MTDSANTLRTTPEQKALTDHLNRASESDKNAHLKRQMEQLERRCRELKLPAERRMLNQPDNSEGRTDGAREQLSKARLGANEVAGTRETERRKVQREVKAESAYAAYRQEVLMGTLEKGDARKIKVNGRDLTIPKDASHNPDTPEFWNRHGNTRETYDKFARQYPELRKRLAEGKKIEELRDDLNLKGAASFWYSEHDMVVANEYKGNRFVEQGYHRATLAKEHNLEGVPVTVHTWSEKENR